MTMPTLWYVYSLTKGKFLFTGYANRSIAEVVAQIEAKSNPDNIILVLESVSAYKNLEAVEIKKV